MCATVPPLKSGSNHSYLHLVTHFIVDNRTENDVGILMRNALYYFCCRIDFEIRSLGQPFNDFGQFL